MPRDITAEYKLLHSGYDHLGVLLDLYGDVDSDGPEVHDVSLVGDKRSLVELIPAAALESMTWFVERRMDETRQESLGQARIDWAEWLSEFTQ